MELKSPESCDRCDRPLQTHTMFVDSPTVYCRHCRVNYWKRSLIAALLAALIAMNVAAYLSYAEGDFMWVGIGSVAWMFCIPLFFISGPHGARLIAITFFAYALAIQFVYHESETGFTPEGIAVVECIGSIFLVLIVYRWMYRNECMACGHRTALKKTGTKRHIEEELVFAAHDIALWRCKYCQREVWKAMWHSYQGSGDGA